MAHVIIVTQQGTGPDGSATSSVEYTPSHDVPAGEQMRKVRKAERVLERLNDFLYGEGEDPSPGDPD